MANDHFGAGEEKQVVGLQWSRDWFICFAAFESDTFYDGAAFKAVVMDTDLEPGRSFVWVYATRTMQGWFHISLTHPIYFVP